MRFAEAMPRRCDDELGDLLLQVVFHARMAEESGLFDFGGVVDAVSEKLVRRHPHVFGDATIESARAQPNASERDAWERQKVRERAQRGETSLADGIPQGLPALMRARKMLGRAARAGLETPGNELREQRLVAELASLKDGDRAQREDALGELLLALTSFARSSELDAEAALRGAVARLEARLRALESERSARR